jgi:hypothetical protein
MFLYDAWARATRVAMASEFEDLSQRDYVSIYVRERIRRECEGERGRASRIAEATGVTPVHIHNVRVGNRRVGDDFAMRIAEYWGMSIKDLVLEAFAMAGESKEGAEDPLPNLTATLVWCRGGYPSEFLKEYAKFVEGVQRDLSRREWLDDIDAQLRNWAAGIRMTPRVLELERSGVRSKLKAPMPAKTAKRA